MSTHTRAERDALSRFPQLRCLLELREQRGWVFGLRAAEGEIDLIVGYRILLDGWTDALAVRDLGDATAVRCDPAGNDVWRREGGLLEVVNGLIELPAPDQPGAPRRPLGRPLALWSPRQP